MQRCMAVLATAFHITGISGSPSEANQQFTGVVDGFATDTVMISTPSGDVLVPATSESLVAGYQIPVWSLDGGSPVTVYIDTQHASS